MAALLILGGSGALAADQQVHLTVQISDEQGKTVSGARVNVHQSNLFLFRRGVVVPADYQEQTNAEGIARLTITAKSGEKLDLAIEVAREDMETQTRNLDLGTQFPTRPPLEKFTLKKKSEGGAGPVIKVAINVQSDGEPVEGANVVILDTSLGTASGRFAGVSGSDGRATIPILYASADPEEKLPVEVSKSGYKNGKIVISLNKKQIGTTVVSGIVVLEKAAKGATKVTVTVRDKSNNQGVGNASVILDGVGYHSDTTNSGGNVTFLVPEIGTFEVRISQDNYRLFAGQIRLLQGDKERPFDFELEPKEKKDEAKDVIEVTVLGRDPTDEKSKPSPVVGALARVGTRGRATDANGLATLHGSFGKNEEVTVEATGYKTKSKTVAIDRLFPLSSGTGKASFILDPELSETGPLRLIVLVTGPDGPLDKASVDFFLPNGRPLHGGYTKADGEKDFRGSDARDVPVAELRKGLVVKVKREGYKEASHNLGPDQLKPMLEANRYSVELSKDWTALAEALAALEARLAAWESARFIRESTSNDDRDTATISLQTSESLFKEIDAAKAVFHLSVPGIAAAWCRKASEFQEKIRKYEAEATKKAGELKGLLDEAATVSSTCSGPADPEKIRTNYRSAIKLLAEVGANNKKAVQDRDELLPLAQESLAMKELLKEMEKKLADIAERLRVSKDIAAKTVKEHERVADVHKSLGTRQIQLKAELAVLTVKYDTDKAAIPSDLRGQIDNLRARLNNPPPEPGLRDVDEDIAKAPEAIERLHRDAERLVQLYRSAACEIDTLDQMVEGIDTTFTNVTFEIGLAADLPKQADACAAKIAAADEVTVPDVSGFVDVGKMMAAVTQAGMVPSLAATNATAGTDGGNLVARQEPLANTKAKRGQKLTIFLNQKVAEKKALATPTPTATPVIAAGASPTGEVIVPTLAAGSSVAQMKAALASVGLVGSFNAAGKPPKKDLEFKFSGAQEPAGGKKAKRGSTVAVSVYQKFEESTAQASPTATAAKTTGPDTMPDLKGLTLEQAMATLTSNMRIGGDEVGDKPPSPKEALTIYSQTPIKGTKLEAGKQTVVTVKRYGTVSNDTIEPSETSNIQPKNRQSTDAETALFGKPSKKKKLPAPTPRKKKKSTWWRDHGHDRDD